MVADLSRLVNLLDDRLDVDLPVLGDRQGVLVKVALRDHVRHHVLSQAVSDLLSNGPFIELAADPVV